MPVREHRRPPSPIKILEYARLELSDSPNELSLLVSGTGPILTFDLPASPTSEDNESVSTLSSPDYSIQEVTGDSEQPDYPV